MTSKGMKLLSSDKEERTKLLSSTDDYNIVFEPNDGKLTKKRARKYSDADVCDLVDIGGGHVPRPPPQDQCVEAEVQPGETLASISLKYNIPVGELKRVNNIYSDSQFYALKRIRIPVKAASLLTEILPAVHEAKGEAKLENGWFVRDIPSPTIQTGGTSSTVPSTPPSDTEYELVQLNSHPESLPIKEPSSASKQTRKAKRFLKNVDKDVARIKEKLDIDEEQSEDDENVLNRIKNGSNSLGFVDSIRASKSRTACCLFVVIISVVIIVILIFAHQEYEIIEEKHHHKHHTVSKGHHQ